MSVEECPGRLAVRDLDDLIGVVPYLVGFHPSDSLVIMVVDDGEVAVTARVDLARVDPDDGGLGELVERLFGRFPSAEAWFFAYSDDDECWSLLEACAELAGARRVGRLVQVGAATWRADAFDGPTGEVGVGRAAVEATVLGWPARRSREELAALAAGPAAAAEPRLAAVFDQTRPRLEAWPSQRRLGLMQRMCRRSDVTENEAVELAVLAADPLLRRIAVESLDRHNASAAVSLWSRALGSAPPPWQPGPLGLLGLSAWLTGDGALLSICLERLDQIAPLDPLAALLDWINKTVLPPGEWDGHRDALTAAFAAQAPLTPRLASG